MTDRNNSEIKRFQALMQTLFGAFAKEADQGMLDAYVIAVAGLPYEVVRRAVLEIIKHDDWLPKASQVRQAVKNLLPRPGVESTRAILEAMPKRRPRPPRPNLAVDSESKKVGLLNKAPKPPKQSDKEANEARQELMKALEMTDE